MAACNSHDFCIGVKKLCGSQTGKGLYLQTFIDTASEDFNETFMLAYKTSARSKIVILRFCPACGTNLLELYYQDGRLKKRATTGDEVPKTS